MSETANYYKSAMERNRHNRGARTELTIACILFWINDFQKWVTYVDTSLFTEYREFVEDVIKFRSENNQNVYEYGVRYGEQEAKILSHYAESPHSDSAIMEYLSKLKNVNICIKAMSELHEGDIVSARKALNEYTMIGDEEEDYDKQMMDGLEASMKGEKKYFRTYIPVMDDFIWLTRGQFLVVAGRTSQGKTSIMTSMLYNFSNKHRCLYLTNEMELKYLYYKMLSTISDNQAIQFGYEHGIDSMDLVKENNQCIPPELLQSSRGEYLAVNKNNITLRKYPKFNLPDIEALITKYNTDIVFVDFIQRFILEGRESRAAEFSNIANDLKTIAMEHKCLVVAGSQVNRGVDRMDNDKKGLELSDIKESGGIEEAADIVAMVWRDSKGDDVDVLNMKIAKNRLGKTGHGKITYIKKYNKFESIS